MATGLNGNVTIDDLLQHHRLEEDMDFFQFQNEENKILKQICTHILVTGHKDEIDCKMISYHLDFVSSKDRPFWPSSPSPLKTALNLKQTSLIEWLITHKDFNVNCKLAEDKTEVIDPCLNDSRFRQDQWMFQSILKKYVECDLYATPRELVVWAAHRFRWEHKEKIVKMLVKNGADLSPFCDPLVVNHMKPEVVRLLFDLGADPPAPCRMFHVNESVREIIEEKSNQIKSLKDLARRRINRILRPRAKNAEVFYHLPVLSMEMIRYLLYAQ